MRVLKDNRGYTLAELLTVVVIFTMVGGVTTRALICALRSSDGINVQTYSDQQAISAMNKIISDIRESKSYTILDSGARLSILRPAYAKDANGNNLTYYDRHSADASSEVQYYLSNSTGTVGVSGTWLWWLHTSDGQKRAIARNVNTLLFTVDTTKSIEVNVTTSMQSVDGINQTKQTQLSQRVVYMRNN